MADDDEIGTAPQSAFPWLRASLNKVRAAIARSGTRYGVRSGGGERRSPPPTTGGEAAASFAKHFAETLVGGIVQAPVVGAQKVLNWYDFARTGDRGWLQPGDELAPAGGGIAQYLRPQPNSLGIFGGDVAARNLTKHGRPTAQAALEMARQMEEKGFTSLEIRQATNDLIARNDPALGGVHKGVEGAWKFEISDARARLTGKQGNLGSALEHPELYQAYPELRSMRYQEAAGHSSVLGEYMPPRNFFGRPVGIGDITVNRAGPDILSTLLHEVQHGGPQRVEGFGQGGNPGMFQRSAVGRGAVLEGEIREAEANLARAVEAQKANPTLSGLRTDVSYWQSEVNYLRDPSLAYWRTAGEAEARNVQKRQELTGGERRAMHPELTQDVPNAKQIILQGNRLQKMAQEVVKGPPPVTLNKLREMTAPNKSVTSVAFEMVGADGKVIGKINAGYYPGHGELKIHMIQIAGVEEGVSANMLKPGELKSVLRELKRHYPGIKEVSGTRISGVRGARGEGAGAADRFTNADDITNVPLNPKFRAATGVPGLPLPPARGSIPDEQNQQFMIDEYNRMRDADPDSQFNDYLGGRAFDGTGDEFMSHYDALERNGTSRGSLDPDELGHLRRYFDLRRELNRRGIKPRRNPQDIGPTSSREIMLVADVHVGRNAIRRVEVTGVDDSGGQQTATVRGSDGESFGVAINGQNFGFTSVPPIGSVGYAFMANGRPDQAFLLGMEHPDFRPKDQSDGGVIMYGEQGQFIGMGDDGNLVISAPTGNLQ